MPDLASAVAPGNGARRTADWERAHPTCCKRMRDRDAVPHQSHDIGMFAGQLEINQIDTCCDWGPRQKAQHLCGSYLQTARQKDCRGCTAGWCTPEESLGEDERGDSAWEDMDRGEVLPDMTGPSWACMRPTSLEPERGAHTKTHAVT